MNNWHAFFLVIALAILPTVPSHAAENTPPNIEVKKEGFELPKKGPLISELREDMSDDLPGAETVVRIYEDMTGNRVKESTINGAVFQIEVSPFRGASYVLMDNDGDGLFETKFNGHEPKFVVPQWVIFRF